MWYIIILLIAISIIIWIFIRKPQQKFIAVGNGDTALAISYDGEKWDPIDGVFGSNTIGTCFAIVRGNGRWVAVGNDGDDEGNNIWYSDDGENWNNASSTEEDDNGVFGNAHNSSGKDVLYADNLWVCVGVDGTDYTRCIWWSENGTEWTSAIGDNFGEDENMDALVVKYNDGIWLVGGSCGDDEGSPILWSEDGMEWYSSDFPDIDLFPAVIDLEYNDGIWIAIGYNEDGACVWYSKDNGESWCMASFPSLSSIEKVKFSKDKFYAYGKEDSISSLDGETWMRDEFKNDSIIYGNRKYVSFGKEDNNILCSTDGNKWKTNIDQPFGNSAYLYGLVYG